MAIQRKPKTASNAAAAAAFVSGAPDAAATAEKPTYDKGIQKGHKRQVSITISPDLLRRVDERADAMGTGRSAFISMAIYKALNQE